MSKKRTFSHLPSDVVTDAACIDEDYNTRNIFLNSEISNYSSRYGERFGGNDSWASAGTGHFQTKRPKDVSLDSLGSQGRPSFFDSGLGDSLTNYVDEVDPGFREKGLRASPNIMDNHSSQSGIHNISKECLTHSLKPKLASIRKDEGYSESLTTSQSLGCDNSKNDNQPLVRKNAEGDTMLHLMIIHRIFDAITFLINLATDPSQLNIVNDMQQSPLILAALTKQASVARRLIVAGAELLLQDRHGDTALHVAAKHGHLETLKAVTEPLTASEVCSVKYKVETQRMPQDMNMKNYEGCSPIHLAAAGGHVDVVEHLVELGADPDEMEGKSGLRPIHIAIEREDRDLIRALTEETYADIDATTFYGLSPVQLAAERGLEDVVAYLVNMGADRTDLDVPELSDIEDDPVEDMEVEFKDLKIGNVKVFR